MAQHRHGHHEGGSNGHEAASRKPWLMLMLERKYPTLWFGHVQLGVTLMVFFVALPGQSFFLGTLTPYLIAELGVSSQVVSFYFFLAFSGAAVWLQFVGRLIDKHGTSRMVMLAILPFVSVIWGMASSWNATISGFCYMMLRVTGPVP